MSLSTTNIPPLTANADVQDNSIEKSIEQRIDHRKNNELRPISVTYDIFEYAAGSVFFCIGKTKILVAITIQSGVPPFLRGTASGWLSAEYSMMPASTQVRTQRESTGAMRNGRSVEISRLIGRVLRTIVDLKHLGEKTIMVDCDVLQADGSTRAASITAAYLALQSAQVNLLNQRIIKVPFLRYAICAVSVALVNNQVLLDPTYQEDSASSSDVNFVMTDALEIIEIQGGAEKAPIPEKLFELMKKVAKEGIISLTTYQKNDHSLVHENKLPLFSLGKRVQRPG